MHASRRCVKALLYLADMWGGLRTPGGGRQAQAGKTLTGPPKQLSSMQLSISGLLRHWES